MWWQWMLLTIYLIGLPPWFVLFAQAVDIRPRSQPAWSWLWAILFTLVWPLVFLALIVAGLAGAVLGQWRSW